MFGTSAPEEPRELVEINKAGAGIAIAGALLMLIAVFLPRVETSSFSTIAENTLMQNGDGWIFIGIAIGIVGATYRFVQCSRPWAPAVLGLVAIGVAIYDGTRDRITLVSLADESVTEQARVGVGLYAAGAAGVLAFFGGSMLRGQGILPIGAGQAAARRIKRCPDCAETVLADARICKHCRHEFVD